MKLPDAGLWLALFVAPLIAQASTLRVRKDALVLASKTCAVAFSRKNGSILSLEQQGRGGPILASGELGLWHVRFQDGSEARAADFASASADRSFRHEVDREGGGVRLLYRSAQVDVTVVVTGRGDGVDFVGEVVAKGKAVLDFALPARLRFQPEGLERFICPANGNQSVGTAFNASFFRAQPQDRPSGWRPHSVGPKGYALLYGGPLVQREDNDPPTALRVTDEGRKWLRPALARRVHGAHATVNRPPTSSSSTRPTAPTSRRAISAARDSSGASAEPWATPRRPTHSTW